MSVISRLPVGEYLLGSGSVTGGNPVYIDGSGTTTSVVAGDTVVVVLHVSNLSNFNVDPSWDVVNTDTTGVVQLLLARRFTTDHGTGPLQVGTASFNISFEALGLPFADDSSSTPPLVVAGDVLRVWDDGPSSTTITAPSVTMPRPGLIACYFGIVLDGGPLVVGSPLTSHVTQSNSAWLMKSTALGYQPVSGGNTGTRTATHTAAEDRRVGASVGLVAANQAPNAPVLTAPADASTIDRNVSQRFDWDFSDPDSNDSQSAYNFRYRAVGAATWTETGWQASTQTYHDVSGGTFADSTDYEWQAATKDAQGVEGPFSSSWFFTAGTAPTPPTITEPVNGGTFLQSQTVTWSTPDQDAYQIRVMDGTTVVSDTGAVTSSTARSTSVEFPTNGVTRTIQLRIQDGGLWSQWAEVTGTVSWLAPPAPTFTLLEDPAQGRMSVAISNPTPSGEEPATSYNDVLIDDDDGEGFDYRHGSRMLTPNGTYIYHLPRSGVDYSDKVRVVSYAENGVYSTSD